MATSLYGTIKETCGNFVVLLWENPYYKLKQKILKRMAKILLLSSTVEEQRINGVVAHAYMIRRESNRVFLKHGKTSVTEGQVEDEVY